MNETGAVKFNYESVGGELGRFPGFEELNAARQELRRRGLLGVDQSGIGFGNVSMRDGVTDSFYITGSGTGVLAVLTPNDCARVTAYDFDRNWLRCAGQAIASAESLTHAAVYLVEENARVVLHGHGERLWNRLLEQGPATGADVPYGTPEMAREVQRLFRETDVQTRNIFAMAGHKNGIIAFGRDFAEALAALL